MIRALTKSTGRLKEIVEMRIKQEMTLAEIGAHFSISRQRVRQILEKVRNGDYNKG
jgi:DNA-directed RNA polymerase sigma subunit (sigma70/sigma32)